MRRSDFWERLNAVLGAEYAASWSRDVVLPSLGDTVEGCFDRGEDTAVVWRDQLATVVPIYLVAVVLFRVVRGSQYDTKITA